MIELTRKQIQKVRATVRQALGLTSARRAPTITLEATSASLLIRSATDSVAVEYRVPGDYQQSRFAVPYEALAACEGRQEDLVRFEQAADQVTVNWSDAGIPQSVQYATSEPIAFPESTESLVAIDRQFLSAMTDACETTQYDSTRFTLNCVRLRGADGQIAATDAQQALLQTGFRFPWDNEILVPSTAVFLTFRTPISRLRI